MNVDDVDVLERTKCYDGYFHIERFRLQHRRFDGQQTVALTREVFQRGHAAAAVLYDPDVDRLVLIEQFRIGAFAADGPGAVPDGLSPWMIEIVAGIIEEGETPEVVIRREAIEEAGREIRDMVPAGFMYVSPGASTESIHLYCGRVEAGETEDVHGRADENEDIRTILASPDDVFRWMDDGRIINATALVGLYWFRTHRDRIREMWRPEAGRASG